ncbi:hypothetical protein HYPSUDRAFT_38163 [Hypholoma sublateritium FD-334 SS-4]|uniref:Uncharacterized protein n=1 Tax=Hypholoma sublateritium (strain FD-334 SS-4) TaxID=945553 RepID=A0A0D2LD17_HYPSF|nr:hypothetical protein HYPSUDRAFT_38163 [Hypholoma sublateritium FD-334 SS-4]
MSRECPSVAELIAAVKSLTRATDGTFQTAWKDSFIDPFHCCEQGGYIYIDLPVPSPLTRAFITRAPKGATMNQRTAGPNASIDLNSPGINQNNVILVANFHTHPLAAVAPVNGSPEPSRSDMENAYFRGVPGIVVSRSGVYAYGPERRESLLNPKGYPASVPQGPLNFRLVVQNPPGPPTVVPGLQWPEGIPGARGAVAEDEGEAAGSDDLGPAGDVIEVEWSSEGVEYGDKLVENRRYECPYITRKTTIGSLH